MFFASLEESRAAGDGDEGGGGSEPIYVGVGVGLFARFWLDHFRDLARNHGRDYYDRLCFVLADKSPRMLLDVSRHGILAEHAGHYRLRVVDALKPEEALPYDVAFAGGRQQDRRTDCQIRPGRDGVTVGETDGFDNPSYGKEERPAGRFRAVFLNYLLDCLPAAVLDVRQSEEKQAEQVRLLHVRTCLARNVNLLDHTDMTIEQVRERARSSDAGAREELLPIYGLFASEYAYLPLASDEGRGAKSEKEGPPTPIPYLDFALDFARKNTNRLVHSYGAIQCLEKLLGLVDEDGFILINDYGQAEIKADDDFEHQRFSLATFVGVNFPLLKAYFESGGKDAVGRIVNPSWCDAETGHRQSVLRSGEWSAKRGARGTRPFTHSAPRSALHTRRLHPRTLRRRLRRDSFAIALTRCGPGDGSAFSGGFWAGGV